MIRLDIQGFGVLELRHFVTDFSGTLAVDGRLLPGVMEKLNDLSSLLTIHVLTSDTFGRAREELSGIACRLHVLEGHHHLTQKENYVAALGADTVAALGNGNNDAGMLRAARLGICVCMDEGCAVASMNAAGILVPSPIHAMDLLLNPKRLIATLRR
jgi:soluble P-type ATPase